MSMILLWWIVSTSRRTELPAAAGRHLGDLGLVAVDELSAAILAKVLRRHPPELGGLSDRDRARWRASVAGIEAAEAAVVARLEARGVSSGRQRECRLDDIGAVSPGEVPDVTTSEAAGMLGVDVRTAQRLAASLGGHRSRVGDRGDWRIPRAAVLAEAERRQERT